MNRRVALVVEDETPVRRLVCQRLRKRGFLTIEAERLEEALLWLGQDRVSIDAIFLDLNLPNGNGIAMLNKMKESRDDIPVVVMSGHIEHRPEVDRMPFAEWLSKPFDDLAFGIVLDRVLNQRGTIEGFTESSRNLAEWLDKRQPTGDTTKRYPNPAVPPEDPPAPSLPPEEPSPEAPKGRRTRMMKRTYEEDPVRGETIFRRAL